MRKTIIVAAAALVAFIGTPSAQEWPARPITMIIPFAAGGGVDASGRIQAQRMGELLGTTIVVENVGAGAGTVGSLRVARATPDGYTMLMGNTGTHAYSQGLRKVPPYNSNTDFAPVGLVTESPRILVARKDLPVKNLQEFVAYVKANQAKMQFGSAGVGSGTHLPCELLNSVMGAKVTHIPYKGAAPVMQDLIGGRIDYMCDTIQTGAAQASAGSVKGIAVMSPRRVPIIPDLATTGEQGLQGVDATVWNGFFFPKGTPDAIVRRMNKVMNTMIEDPAMRKRLEELGLEILPADQRTPEYLSKYLAEEIDRWKKVIVQAGIPVE
ncbi:MAG TPA: tripartite tricarboxylate transporter substrate binding protein [Xanthobacteraceae bacterium]|nr:tripartite tricarboxylate transporter substrate binding protein [Xanthobacteraceae bacterium]